jgi:hypothetical protein
MSLEFEAVQGMVVTVDQTTVLPAVTPLVATIVISPPTAIKVNVAALVYRDGDQITVSAITVPSAGATIPDPGPYLVAMEATAIKTKAEGIEVLREGDLSEQIDATPQVPGSPPVDYPVSFKCIVSDAGQVKFKAQ